MRTSILVVITAAMFFVTSMASAVQFNITGTSVSSGNSLNALLPGDLVTIDIRIDNESGEDVFGVGASVFGYDESVADFQSGSAVPQFLSEFCVLGVGCFNGLPNLADGPLVESAVGAYGNRVQIAIAVSLTPVSGAAAAMDPGLDGVINGGDAQFRVIFQALALGTTTLQIGTGYIGDHVTFAGGITSQAVNSNLTLTVVPEPGTALLMGLGLASLAASGRRY